MDNCEHYKEKYLSRGVKFCPDCETLWIHKPRDGCGGDSGWLEVSEYREWVSGLLTEHFHSYHQNIMYERDIEEYELRCKIISVLSLVLLALEFISCVF